MKIAILENSMTSLQSIEHSLFDKEKIFWNEIVECREFTDSINLLSNLKTEYFDCVVIGSSVDVININMILQSIRQYDSQQNRAYTSVVVISKLHAESDMLACFNAGADDYLTAPFRPRELGARVQRLIRANKIISRLAIKKENELPVATPRLEAREGSGIIKISNYEFNSFEQTVTCKGQVIELTEREFSLALLFFRNLGKPVSRELIFSEVWQKSNNLSSRTLDTHIYRLRHLLNLTVENGFVLRTVYGFGYRLDVAGPRPIRKIE
ncbi:response regulator transcription factor [Hydromonas duriensis]|uniref:DNA-binding response OmpR family regulator n=1 Tax=Hydromonas duriensis TaxID=1527608 RepID=A0A4R6Y8P4_9BURK|nr:response regulator transcription factor [Hydromonas duriensis]TDR31786.1 DNA-binding response OmpR family regulator [Hydromonas duriensis]